MLDLCIMGMVCAVCTYNNHALQLHELLHAALVALKQARDKSYCCQV